MGITSAEPVLIAREHGRERLTVVQLAWVMAGLKVVLHLFTNLLTPYGLHRDEFLYLAMGDHLAWGFHEVPPFIAGAAWLVEGLGGSLLAARLLPALAGGAVVLLTGLAAQRFGGGRFAVLIATLAVIVAPVYLRPSNLFQPVVFDQLAWLTAAFCFVQRVEREDARWWLAVGAACGVGLLVKYSMLFLGAGLFAGVLLTRSRRDLLTPWPWAGALLALLIVSPNVAWQVTNGWPLLAHMQELAETQLVHVSRIDFLREQVLIMHPFTFPVWAAGLVFFFTRRGEPYRVLGWAILVAVGLIMLGRGKPYYAGPVYPMLLAGGGVMLQAVLSRAGLRWAKPALAAALVAGGLLLLPVGLPVLPPVPMERYVQATGLEGLVRFENGRVLRIPQDYHDMMGWEELVGTVAGVYHALPEADRQEAVLLTGNYGEAGAIDYYGGRYRLPGATSTNSSYYNWGPGVRSGEVAVAIGIDLEDLVPYYRSCVQATTHRHPWAIFYETDLPVYVCRNLYRPLRELWPELK